jgi:RNA polymerase sigma-70 factor, ECF subfamily
MEELIKLIATRDERALAALHRIMHQRIVAFAMKRLDDKTLAEEVMLETLFEVWKHAPSYAGTSRASTWILGIARNKSYDKLRTHNPRLEALSDEHLDIASDEVDGLERVAACERASALHDCIKQLSTVQRECVHLVFYQELAMEEIASMQNCPANTIKTRMFHARRKLRTCMEASGHGGQS